MELLSVISNGLKITYGIIKKGQNYTENVHTITFPKAYNSSTYTVLLTNFKNTNDTDKPWDFSYFFTNRKVGSVDTYVRQTSNFSYYIIGY